MITRDKAIEVLYRVINSGILNQDVEVALQDIANCIEMEETHGVHAWGADDENVSLLVVARREDCWTDEIIQKTEDAYNRLKF